MYLLIVRAHSVSGDPFWMGVSAIVFYSTSEQENVVDIIVMLEWAVGLWFEINREWNSWIVQF
jgi:hypothetical protein